MREFFTGGRRKIGVLTLLIACLLAAGWVRSFIRGDGLLTPMGQIISHHGGLFFEIAPSLFDFGLSYFSSDAKSMTNAYIDPTMVDLWHWRMLGFAVGTADNEIKNANVPTSQVKLFRLYIPYWSIVISLTLLSASLLLAKPRPAKKADLARTEIAGVGIDQ